jgi:ubiquinone/menaquinone biosynthesis C-methylase UbiE
MDSKEFSQERYSKYAQGYVTSQAHAKGYDLDLLVELAQPQLEWLVLDIATGGGHTALKFAPYVNKVVATDITPKMLKAAQEFVLGKGITNITFEPADAEELPFENSSFDLVTCRIAPHHFPDCARFVREGARVLKPDGLLMVQDHVLPEDGVSATAKSEAEIAARYVDSFERLRDPSHNRAYNHEEWVGMFEAAGLSVEHTEEVIKRHTFLPWAERQGCTQEVITQLKKMLVEAPSTAAQWLEPRDLDSPEASFVNHHILIKGRKKTPVNAAY